MTTKTERSIDRCSQCGIEIELCALCDGTDCPVKICYRCLRVDLGQSKDHPHEHGG